MHAPPTLLLPLLLGALPGGAAYGFRNCVQAPAAPGRFRCVGRCLGAVGAAVGDLPPNATALNVSHNALRRLPPAAFARLPRLRALDLAHNRLRVVAPGAFAGLGALLDLDLSHNRLAGLGQGALAGLGNLSRLRLDHNPLGSLAPSALPLPGLAALWLRGARLPALGAVTVALQPLHRLCLLDLCGSGLEALGPGPPLPASLRTLRLCNNSLGGLRGGAPALPPALRDLDLSYNNISDAAAVARLRLRDLGRLRLAGNPLDAFALLRASDLRPQSLDFSGLRLGPGGVDAVCRSLAGTRRLRRLRLRRDGLEALPDGALGACPPVEALDLTGNRLRRLPCVGRLLGQRQRGRLRELVLEHNLLRRPPSCPAAPVLPRLLRLSLRFNRILAVGPRAFADAPGLRLLRLDVNGLARLHRRALRGLRELRELRLDNNLLTDVFPGSFAGLGRLRRLSLRNNRVAVLFPGAFAGLGALQTLDLGGNNMRHLGAAALQGLGALRRLYLDRNRLQELSAAAFRPVQAGLAVLDLRANALRYGTARPRQPPPFRHLRHLRALRLQAQQPYGLRLVPHRFFQGLVALRSLSLARNALVAVPADAFDDLAQLRYLALADGSSGLGRLPAGVFKNLSHLRSLDLVGAGLRSLGPEVWGNLSRLERLRLAGNGLRALDERLRDGLPALRYLDLRHVPLSCACANAWLPAWLARGPAQVVYFYDYTCGGEGPRAFLHAFDACVCFGGAGPYLFATSAPAVLLLLALPLLRRHAYWYLRYRLYLLRAWAAVCRPRQRRRYAYDGFVSYSSADQRWVLGELVPELERGALRLCLHHRDFRPGRALLDNIVDAVYGSRRTLCVLSRAYLRSAWCALEVQLAAHRLVEELRDALVLVLLEPIPPAQLATFRRLRRVLTQRPPLRWPPEPSARPLFWAKLARALHGEGEGKEGEEGEEGGGGRRGMG